MSNPQLDQFKKELATKLDQIEKNTKSDLDSIHKLLENIEGRLRGLSSILGPLTG